MNFKIWWGLNIFWLIFFGAVFTYLMVRKINVTGSVPVYSLRMFSLAIMGYFIGIIGVIQVFLFFHIRGKNKANK